MNKVKPQKNLFARYLGRHLVLISALVVLIAYYALRDLRVVADFATTYIARLWHYLAGTLFGFAPFSVAEWLCALAVLGVLAYLMVTGYKMIRKPKKLQRLYGALIALLGGALMIYALVFCWLWGIGYYSYTYAELSGVETHEVRVEELKEVTIYFAERANAAGEAVQRDEDGVYTCDTQGILSQAPKLYDDLPERFAFLEGLEVRPKSLVFSYLMSVTNFTGVFFPLTGEPNLNTHAPDCFIPSAAAHELAHQRGVFREQDANFTAVMVCMESSDANYQYSGALLAYLHLSNALWQASPDDWEEAYSHVGEQARRDLAANNAYWAQFESPVAEVSETAYEEFLQNQGQELGMRSYGACVDLLIAYYGEEAAS